MFFVFMGRPLSRRYIRGSRVVLTGMEAWILQRADAVATVVGWASLCPPRLTIAVVAVILPLKGLEVLQVIVAAPG